MRASDHVLDAERLADARLTAESSLGVFRAALAALARPGRIGRWPDGVPATVPPELLVALALADLEVAVVLLEPDGPDRWDPVVRAATGARSAASLADADIVIARRAPTPGELSRIRTGDAVAPERGARLVLACTGLHRVDAGMAGDGVAGTVRLRLVGPGAADGRVVAVQGLDPAVFVTLSEMNRAFPAGIDTWLVAPDGAVVGLPRTTSIAIDLDGPGSRTAHTNGAN